MYLIFLLAFFVITGKKNKKLLIFLTFTAFQTLFTAEQLTWFLSSKKTETLCLFPALWLKSHQHFRLHWYPDNPKPQKNATKIILPRDSNSYFCISSAIVSLLRCFSFYRKSCLFEKAVISVLVRNLDRPETSKSVINFDETQLLNSVIKVIASIKVPLEVS